MRIYLENVVLTIKRKGLVSKNLNWELRKVTPILKSKGMSCRKHLSSHWRWKISKKVSKLLLCNGSKSVLKFPYSYLSVVCIDAKQINRKPFTRNALTGEGYCLNGYISKVTQVLRTGDNETVHFCGERIVCIWKTYFQVNIEEFPLHLSLDIFLIK